MTGANLRRRWENAPADAEKSSLGRREERDTILEAGQESRASQM